MNPSVTISTALFIFLLCCWVSVQASSRPQRDDDVRRPADNTKRDLTHSTAARDPLRWIWIDETSVELAWSSKFSLSLNDAVRGYGLSLTGPQQSEPFSTTTIYSSTNLQHEFGGLKSNVTYRGKLEALVGPHHWPYNLLNFTFSSAALIPGVGLGHIADRPASSTADLGSVYVGVTLRWSHSPFTTGELTSNEWDTSEGRPGGVKPDGYLLQIWDNKQLILKLMTSVTGKHEGCIANVGSLSLDMAYKATLESLHDDGRVGITLSFSLDTGGFYVAGGGLTTDGVSDCYSGLQVRCPASERCVSPYWICDGAPDCPDGEDEIGCDKSPCDGFRCWDNVCIPGAWRCDGHNDCKDGDDEYACSACGEGEMACSTFGFCFYPNATCDGIPDCPDGWDESLAVCGGKECSPGELPCWDNDHCVQHSRLCDGTPDCPTSEDEDRSFCVAFKSMQETTTLAVDLQASLCDQRKSINRNNCSLNDYQCESGECIPKMYLCNGHFDCRAGDDEEPNACSMYNNITPVINLSPKNATNQEGSGPTCRQNMFRCPSGKCIGRSEKCPPNELCNYELMERACKEDSVSNVDNEIESNVIDESDSLELETPQTFGSEVNWEDGLEILNDPGNMILGHSKIIEIDNMTILANADHNLTAPVLRDLDLESLEDVSQTPYDNPSQENPISQGETTLDVSVEVMVEDSEESTENELEITTISGDEENQIDYSEFTDGNEVDTSLLHTSFGSVSNVRGVSTDEFLKNTTTETFIPDYDIFENYNVSSKENEIDDMIINTTTKTLRLDSDEESDVESPVESLFNSSIKKSIKKDNMSASLDEIEMNFSGKKQTNETASGIQNEFNSSLEEALVNSQDEIGSLTTELPMYDTTFFAESILTEDHLNTTTETADTEYDLSSPTITGESTVVYTISGKDVLLENITEKPHDEIEVSNSPYITEPPTTDDDNQSMELETPELTTTTDSVVLLQPASTESSSNLENSDVQIPTEEDEKQHQQSITEAPLPSVTDAPIISSERPETITQEPDNWKEMPLGQKNLTILIAVHSMTNESRVPQYIIHGLDGSTYEYEVVGVNEEVNKTEANTGEDERQMVNEEFSGNIHELSYLHDSVSSGTKSSFGIVLLIPLVMYILINN